MLDLKSGQFLKTETDMFQLSKHKGAVPRGNNTDRIVLNLNNSQSTGHLVSHTKSQLYKRDSANTPKKLLLSHIKPIKQIDQSRHSVQPGSKYKHMESSYYKK